MYYRLLEALRNMKKPVVAGIVGPPDTDKIVSNGRICKLTVLATKEKAPSYFPLGFTMIAADVAVAYIHVSNKDAEALDQLRRLGTVIMVSPAKEYKKGIYEFDGIMISYSTSSVGDNAWHVLTGGYPPLIKGKELMYKYPQILALVESVISGGGLTLPADLFLPIEIVKEVPVEVKKQEKQVFPTSKMEEVSAKDLIGPFHPFIALGLLASWRASRAARKKADE